MASRTDRSPDRSRKSVRASRAYAEAKRPPDGDGEEGPTEPAPAENAEPGADAGPAAPAEAQAVPKAAKAKPVKVTPASASEPAAEPPVGAKPATGPTGPAAEPAAAPAPTRPAPTVTALPKPSEVVSGDPDASEPPPGLVPPGDSRSMRRLVGSQEEFVLVYRHQNFLVTRAGVVGKRGHWRVTNYPTQASAAHAYAQECSRLVTDGYVDYRD